MTDQITITWTDDTGTYENRFIIENPALSEVKKAYTSPMMMSSPEPVTEETQAEFYARISLSMVSQVMYQAQQHKVQQATQLIPPVSITPVEAVTKDE